MKIEMPIDAKEIIYTLQANDFQAYLVGGCVRDSILGREPKDWDITTNALPEDVISLFNSTHNIIETGLKHGTVTIIADSESAKELGFMGIPIEVTTFRTDGKYSDNRHPDSVQFTTDLKEDLSRRDFTINAMAYNEKEGLIDYFNGLKDLEYEEINCVGNAEERFQEDALRMIRAIRFASQLGFSIYRNIDYAIQEKIELLKNISKKRIHDEFNKILMSDYFVAGIKLLGDWNIMNYICPEIYECYRFCQANPYHIYDVFEHTLKALELTEKDLTLRLVIFFHDIGKPKCFNVDENGVGHFYGHSEISSEIAVNTMRILRYDNAIIIRVRDLVLYHDIEIDVSKKSIRKWLNKIGKENFKDILKIRCCDILSQNLKFASSRLEKTFKIKQMLEEVLKDKECFSKKDLAINGTDLINMGYPEGKKIGEIINKLVDIVLDEPTLNTKEQLVELVKTF